MMLRLLTFLILIFGNSILLAQNYTTSMELFNLENGLSHNQINWIYQDSRGMMWIGAANGINRYDGKEFKLVAELDFFYLGNDRTFEDHEGDLWIKSNYWTRELIFFNIYTEKVTSLEDKFGEKNPLQGLEFTNAIALMDSTIIIGSDSGILTSYHPQDGFKSQRLFERGDIEPIAIPGTNQFWLKVNDENINLDSITQVQLWQKKQDGGFKKLLTKRVPATSTLLGCTPEKAIISLDTSGIYTLTQANGQQQSFPSAILPKSSENKKLSDPVYDVQTDRFLQCKSGQIYSQSRLNPEDRLVSNKYKDLETNHFYCTFFKENVLWIGTMSGLLKIQIKSSPFEKVAYKNPDIYPAASFNSCRSIIDYLPEKFEDTLPDIKSFQKNFWTYYKDKNGREWYGAFFGLYYRDQGESVLHKLVTQDSSAIQINFRVYQIFEDQQQQVWIVSANGLFQLDTQRGRLIQYTQDNPPPNLPAKELRHMYQDEDGTYWIASNKGLIHWDNQKNEHRLFNTKDGFSNNHIMAVYEDDFGFLWMSSDNGIMQFEKRSGRVKVYLPKDGISHREFNRNAHLTDEEGRIYFGSVNGITHFHPGDFTESFEEQPDIPLLLTECKIVSGKTAQLENRIASFFESKKITLYPGDRSLKLKFALLDYVSNNLNTIQYAYQLDQDQVWNIGSENVINFNALAYGEHILWVKARTGNGFFSKQTLTIPIRVLRPFYMQWWFLALGVLAMFGLVFLFQKMKTKSLLKRQVELEEIVSERTKTIRLQTEKLQQLDKTKSRFLANISHELRTPLTLLLNIIHDPELAMDEMQKKYMFDQISLEIMQRNADRLRQLIDQLLSLSRLEAGKMTMQTDTEDFRPYLNTLVETFRPMAEKKQLHFIFETDEKECLADFDKGKMDQVLYNLLSNAIKFTPAGGSIKISLEKRNTELLFSVRDTGVGIPEEDLDKIFDRFYQVKRADEYAYEGTGLGLALVHELVTLHQGRVSVQSTLNEGTRFDVFLPLHQSSIKTAEQAKPESIASREPVVKNEAIESDKRPILLIIEDNKDLLYHQGKLFREEFQVELAADGQEGLEKALELIPDIIISDIMMSGKSGYEVCQQLKIDERTNHIPVILLTARAGQEEKIRGLKIGADDYVTKPYDQRELILRVRNQLEQIRTLQKQYSASSSIQQEILPSSQEKFLQKLYEIIELQLSNRHFGINELSREVHLSRSQLFRKLKAITGKTPNSILRSYRLQRAKELLIEEDGNATNVSYQVGFNNPNYFFKCFKDEFGMTPGQYMAQLRKV